MLFIRDCCSVRLDIMKLKRVDWPFKRLIFFQFEIIWYSGADGKQLCRSLELNQSLFPLQTSRDGSVHLMPTLVPPYAPYLLSFADRTFLVWDCGHKESYQILIY